MCYVAMCYVLRWPPALAHGLAAAATAAVNVTPSPSRADTGGGALGGEDGEDSAELAAFAGGVFDEGIGLGHRAQEFDALAIGFADILVDRHWGLYEGCASVARRSKNRSIVPGIRTQPPNPGLPMPIPSRNTIVTGGTGALGAAVVGLLLARGDTCHIPVHNEEELKRFPLTAYERVKIVSGIDLTDEPLVEKFFGGVGGTGGGLWASVHIAGGFAYGPIEGVRKADFVAQMQQNALTCFLCSREAVKLMGSGGGRIVNVAARPAVEPRLGANMVAYTAAKAAVAAITQALAEEVVGRGILVNAVLPSIMDTPANRKSMPDADFAKWPRVEDVAATIAFLASAANTCTRGGLVPVYGTA